MTSENYFGAAVTRLLNRVAVIKTLTDSDTAQTNKQANTHHHHHRCKNNNNHVGNTTNNYATISDGGGSSSGSNS
jgi:Asp-tRNA(Asn)/Glu-tRNA(Gln) amidotransferase A subunit family amidase